MLEAIRFYCGVNETLWNHHAVVPGPYACVAPVYGRTEETHSINRVSVPSGVQVIQDSGAFSDGPTQRLDFSEALDRQIAHAERYQYSEQITHRASYDLLIDERWKNGVRSKLRWDEGDAEFASRISVRAAAYIAHERHGLPLILSAQGVTPRQYLKCAEQIVPLMEQGDVFGLGGWCILGKIPSLLHSFRETMKVVIPFLASEHVKQVHIWGVCFPKALNDLLWLCNEHDIRLSTDSAYPAMAPAFGNWGIGSWRDNKYSRPAILESCKSGKHHLCVRCRGLERIRHVEATRQFFNTFAAKRPTWLGKPQQMELMEIA